jgi:hypothetical protein
MRSQFVGIDGVGRKDSPQVGLDEDDDVIEAFPADRTALSRRPGSCGSSGRPVANRMKRISYSG